MYSSVIRKIWEWSTTRLLAGGWDSRKSPSNPQISFALEPLERRVLLSAGLPLATFDSPPSNFDNQYEVVDEANILIDINNSNQSIFIPGNDCDSQDTQTDTDRQTLLTINEDFNDIAMESYLYDNAFPDDIAEVTRRELVFIDTNVPDYQRLTEDILACNDDTRDVVVVFLDSDRDGVEQISEALAGYEYLDAVHFISHGAEGSVKLGNTWLNADNMQGYAGAIAGWNDALAGDADMLFYGCDLAAGSEGQDLLSTLSKLTGADVAASEDPTGHALLGGDWELEYRIGAVEAANPFSQGFLANWVSVLAVPSSNGQDNSYEWITNVTFAGIDNTTAKESGGYGDYTSEVASIEQCASSNLSVTISPDSNDYIKAWVDWNQDDDFDDAGESFTVASNVSTSGPHTVSISAPGNAVVGTTVMRVSLRYNAAPPSTGSFDYGEVEDYSVTVTAAPSDPPTAVADSYELTEDSTLSAGGGTTFTEYIIDDTADGAHEIEPVDLDDDGDIDLIGTMYRDNKVVWYENDGNENFTENEIDASFVQASSSVTIDLDEDGDLDILVTGEGEDDIYWFENDGSESFTKNTITPSLGGAGGLQIGDVNGDNNLDIVACGGEYDDIVYWFENDGSENFTEHIISNTNDSGRRITLIDLNEDNHLDVVSANYRSGEVLWYENDGSGSFTSHDINMSLTGSNDVYVADLDGDGDLDVLSSAQSGDKVYWHENDGSENFTTHSIDPGLGEGWAIWAADIDGDSDTDIMVGAGTSFAWLENNGYESFTTHVLEDSIAKPRDIRAADVDSDGDLDILSATIENQTFAWYENDGSGVGVLANDSDPDGDPLTVFDYVQPTNGSVTVNADGSFIYTPNAGFSGADSFDYVATDGNDGTVHYWKLDGDAVDSVGVSDGTINGTTTVTGRFGNALSFDEVSDYVQIPDFTYTDEFTVSFWFKVDDISGSSYQYLYSHGTLDQPNSLNINLGESGSALSGVLLTNFMDSNDVADAFALNVDINSVVGDGQWHLYTLSADSGAGASVYIDGVLGSSDASRGGDSFNPGTDLFLGTRYDFEASQFYGGQLDGVQVFDRTLGTSEVTDLYTGGNVLGTASITVNALDDTAPVQVNNTGSTISEGGTDTLANIELRYDDSEQNPSDVNYTVTGGLANGQLELTTGPGVAINSFTQDDIDNNRLVYIHDGSNTTTDSFDFDVDDGQGNTLAGQSFVLTITAVDDDAPTQVNNTGSTISEGGTDTLSNTELRYDDSEQNPSDVNYTVTGGLTNGQLELTTGPGVAINSFTQDDIDNSRVVYVHDGSNTTSDSFDFDVDDGQGNTFAGQSFVLTITAVDDDAPTQVNNTGSTISEGGTDTLSNTELRYDDSEQNPSDVNYTVTGGLANGQLELTTGLGVAINSFTQDDIDNNRVVYVHDGSNTTSDSFDFDVDDGQGNTIAGQSFSISVTAVSDASVLTNIEVGALDYTENDGAVAITGTITVSDIDDINIESAIVQITANYQNGQDVLAFADTANITGTWDAATGTLNLIGTDTLANYQAALRSVTCQNTSDNPNTLTRTVSFTVNDGDSDSNTTTRDIAINPVNDAPVVNNQSFSIDANSSNGTSVGTVVASDVDAGDSLTYSITGGNTDGSFAINSSTGVITVANSVELDFETNPIFSLTIQVEDTGTLTDTAMVTINLNDLNEGYGVIDPPITDPVVPDTPDDDQPTDEYEPDEPANATKSNPDSPDSPSEAPSLSSIIAVPPTDASTENMNIFDNLLRATSTDSYGIWSVFKIQSTHQPEDYDSDPKDVSFSMSLIDVSGMESEAETEHLSTKGFAETLRQELDDLVKQLNSQNDYYVHVQAIRIGTVTTLVGTVSIGYVAWILRGGVLLAGLLSHMPTWCSFDPLPVLENWDRGQKNRGQHPDNAEEDEDESEQRVKSIL